MPLALRRFAQQGWRDNRPGEITHLWVLKSAGEVGKTAKAHGCSIAVGLLMVWRFADNPLPLNTAATQAL